MAVPNLEILEKQLKQNGFARVTYSDTSVSRPGGQLAWLLDKALFGVVNFVLSNVLLVST